MYVFELLDNEGRKRQFRAPHPDEITAEQWVELTIPPLQATSTFKEELEQVYDIAERFAKIPRDLLRCMPMPDLRRLMEAFEEVAVAANEERKDDKVIPDTVTHKGVTYTVPKDPSEGILFAQYVDLSAKLDQYEYKDQGIAAVLAVCLVPEGEQYDGSKLDERIEAMRSMPAKMAIRLTAFFFVGSKDLEEIWSRYISRSMASRLRLMQQTTDALSAAMGGSLPSVEPQA